MCTAHVCSARWERQSSLRPAVRVRSRTPASLHTQQRSYGETEARKKTAARGGTGLAASGRAVTRLKSPQDEPEETFCPSYSNAVDCEQDAAMETSSSCVVVRSGGALTPHADRDNKLPAKTSCPRGNGSTCRVVCL